jgi:hypothetical protein
MLEHGLPVDLSDHKGNTLLMLAAYNGNAGTARMLLNRGAKVDRRNDRGQTPLGGVAFKGFDDIAALLIEHGADLDADNGGGMTPLMFAAMFGRAGVLRQLRAHGASLQCRNRLGISAKWMVRISRLLSPLLDRAGRLVHEVGRWYRRVFQRRPLADSRALKIASGSATDVM